jgi:hypothetical protein
VDEDYGYRKKTESGGSTVFTDKNPDFGKAVNQVAGDYKIRKQGYDAKAKGEIIFETAEYILIDPKDIIKMNRSKFNKIKSVDQIKTYNDLAELLKSYISFEKWKMANP